MGTKIVALSKNDISDALEAIQEVFHSIQNWTNGMHNLNSGLNDESIAFDRWDDLKAQLAQCQLKVSRTKFLKRAYRVRGSGCTVLPKEFVLKSILTTMRIAKEYTNQYGKDAGEDQQNDELQ